MKGVACGKFRSRAQNWQKACDDKKRILWPVFGQNKIFWTRRSRISTRVLVLVPGLLTFQVPDVSIDVNSMNMIRNKAENQNTQTQLKWRSLCAPLDIVPLLPLSFFSIFGLSLFFWLLWLFHFMFLIFFLHLGAQKK